MSEEGKFEWDEAKRIATLEKHGIDFRKAIQIFSSDPLELESDREGERRWIAIGILDGIEIRVIFTWRGENRRIITAGRARRDERTAYHARHA